MVCKHDHYVRCCLEQLALQVALQQRERLPYLEVLQHRQAANHTVQLQSLQHERWLQLNSYDDAAHVTSPSMLTVMNTLHIECMQLWS